MRILVLLLIASQLVYCAHNPHKAKEIDTSMEKEEALNGESSIGVKDGDMVYQKKVNMAEELRRLQISVYSMEDRVYGNRKFGSQGLYGTLKKCRLDLVSPENGGDGKLIWTEPIDRVTDKEEEFDIGYDDKDKIIGVSQEFLKDRIARFKDYKKVLQKREDEYKEKVEICDAKLKMQKHTEKEKASN
ncbi:MAG: hypothetical protein KDD33_02030 [Bdellovibrionales bacterium]|nr:hypothetical protein [Bdellovibrionales bacterium]